jgi:hypothetical protein
MPKIPYITGSEIASQPRQYLTHITIALLEYFKIRTVGNAEEIKVRKHFLNAAKKKRHNTVSMLFQNILVAIKNITVLTCVEESH